MKYLLILLIFTFSFNLHAKCFEYLGTSKSSFKSIQISNVMDRKHSILTVVKNKKTFQSSYFCLSKGSIYECSGDDDGGIFTIDTSSKNLELKIQHLNVGEPDHEIFEIPENNKLKLTGKACK